jgi:hypothetical protein
MAYLVEIEFDGSELCAEIKRSESPILEGILKKFTDDFSGFPLDFFVGNYVTAVGASCTDKVVVGLRFNFDGESIAAA